MSDTTFGRVLSVDTRNLAEPTIQPEIAGSTTITVADGSTFNELGGTVKIGDNLFGYQAANADTGVIVLTAPLAVAVDEQAAVEFYPAQPVSVAMVDLGEDGDPVPATVPHALVEDLPDGIREPGQEETVELARRGTFEYVVADVVGQPLADGVIDPERLALGMVGNLVPDPNLQTNLHIFDDPWFRLGPDPAYPGSYYARSVDTSGVAAMFELVSGIPVTVGQRLRVTGLVRHNAASDTPTPAPTQVAMRVEFADPTGFVTLGFSETAVVPLSLHTVDVWTKLEVTFIVPTGCVSARALFEIDYQTAGAVDLILPYVNVISNRVASAGFVEGETGWALDDEVSQMQDLNVLDELGAGRIATSELYLGGKDIQTIIDQGPRGIISYVGKGSTGMQSAGDTSGTTELKLLEVNSGRLQTGRLYRIQAHGFIQGSVATDTFNVRVRYSLDGSLPAVPGGAILDGSMQRFACQQSFTMTTYFAMTGAPAPFRTVLTLQRSAGSGVGRLYLADPNFRFDWLVEDIGAIPVPIVVSGAGSSGDSQSNLSISAQSAGGSADPAPVGEHTKSWPCIWSRSYDGGGAMRAGDPLDCYQGSQSSLWGNQMSLFGFDDADIRASLAGATIRSVTLTYRVRETAFADGMTICLYKGTSSAKPTTWSAATPALLYTFDNEKPGAFNLQSLGTGVGNGLRDGTIKCLGFGPGISINPVYYGRMYGYGTGYAPSLTIEYLK